MAVRIRLKRMGRRHRPFYRICAMDSRTPRDGREIEQLGHYDPMLKDVDARVQLKAERVDYWLGVGALPTPKVGVLIRKYGTGGTHVEQQKQAIERLKASRRAAPVVVAPPAEQEAPAEEPATEVAEAPQQPEAAATEDAAAEESNE